MVPIAFTEMNISRAPLTAGIYALYGAEDVIFYGHSLGGRDTIQSRLKNHIAGRDHPCTRGAKTFSWESCPEPEARNAALLKAFELIHNGLPRCNVG